MAYLRKDNETVEIDQELNRVWDAVFRAIEELKWNIESTNHDAHQVRIKTPRDFISWETTLIIEMLKMSDSTTRVFIVAETPVTTISAIFDFGRARRYIDLFLAALHRKLFV
ncbi:MAG: hypothetical protein QXU99_04000 [Candidatus Bathyarchaeia archaeon]